MFGMATAKDTNCPNCGSPDWSEKEGHECRKCGYKNIKTTKLDEATLVFCEKCACTYLDGCKVHDASVQKKVKL